MQKPSERSPLRLQASEGSLLHSSGPEPSFPRQMQFHRVLVAHYDL